MTTANTEAHILMPAYNAAQFIRSSLDSILKQTYAPVTAIIYDDGSTDNTKEVVYSLTQSLPDSALNKIHLTTDAVNRGNAYARSRLLEISENLNPAASFMWLDADDLFVDERSVETVMTQMSKTKADICLYAFKIRWENDNQELRNNATGLLEEKQEHEKLLAEIAAQPEQAVSIFTCENLMAATSMGCVKAYAAPMRSRWAHPVETLRYSDFTSMAMLLKAERVTAVTPNRPIADFLRRSTSLTGERTPGHFLRDIPQQLERLRFYVDMSDLPRARATNGFIARKLGQYMRLLQVLVEAERPDFTKAVLDQYRALVAKMVPN